MVNIELLEQKRAEHSYSQGQVAKFMGYESHTAYQRKITGARDFTIADITNLCKLFQVELSDLIIM